MHTPRISIEFFPPKSSEQTTRLLREIGNLQELPIDFVSITYGAGGSTRTRTRDLVIDIRRTTRFDPIAHMTCVQHSYDDIETLLATYAVANISTVLALGGDPPRDPISSGSNHGRAGKDSGDSNPNQQHDRYHHAIDLVRHIVDFNRRGLHPRGGFRIVVAGFPEGHPRSPNRMLELNYLRDKVAAAETWSDSICTQLFFDNHDFFDFHNSCRLLGIVSPIIAGLMPIASRRTYERIPDFAIGTRYPAELIAEIEQCKTDTSIAQVALDWTINQCRQLIAAGVDGLHFYCLNDPELIRTLLRRLIPIFKQSDG